MMKTILVTGGIGSGKSAVCRYLAGRGIPVYDCDRAAKELYDTDADLADAVVSAFGPGVRGADGRIDRGALAQVVFSDPAALARLEALVHPAVLRDFLAWRSALRPGNCDGGYGGGDVAVLESAIALEKPLFRGTADAVLLVETPLELARERVQARDGMTPADMEARLRHQHFDPGRADAVIRNDSTLAHLHAEVDRSLKNIIFALSNPSNNMNTEKTDLSKILSVTGQHGLYKYVAQARNGVIAESLADGRRTCFNVRSKITSLADIAIYTEAGEMKLRDVFLRLKETLGDAEASAGDPQALFAKAIPDYDSDRFHPSHMKKVTAWYDALKQYASLDFTDPDADGEEPAEGPAEEGEAAR